MTHRRVRTLSVALAFKNLVSGRAASEGICRAETRIQTPTAPKTLRLSPVASTVYPSAEPMRLVHRRGRGHRTRTTCRDAHRGQLFSVLPPSVPQSRLQP
jgi:hypothetical protein